MYSQDNNESFVEQSAASQEYVEFEVYDPSSQPDTVLDPPTWYDGQKSGMIRCDNCHAWYDPDIMFGNLCPPCHDTYRQDEEDAEIYGGGYEEEAQGEYQDEDRE